MTCDKVGPGPIYGFKGLTGYENHDYTKNRAPAYSLGLRPDQKMKARTPGPYNVGNVDRNGRYPYQGWTIESRATPRRRHTGPSPLSYAPEKMKVYSPAYSLGLRLGDKNRAFGPSAADYFPQFPPQTGYTIGSPWKRHASFVPPGPKGAVPTDLYKNRAPAYSLGLKGTSKFEGTPGPGPKYYPGRICHQVPHAYSFGLRHGKCSPPLITYEDNN